MEAHGLIRARHAGMPGNLQKQNEQLSRLVVQNRLTLRKVQSAIRQLESPPRTAQRMTRPEQNSAPKRQLLIVDIAPL